MIGQITGSQAKARAGATRRWALCSCAAVGLVGLAAGQASAQAPSPAAPASAADVSEIVVTANKRSADAVINVPQSIQAIGGDTLQKAGSSGFLDIAAKIPGLSVQDLGPGDRKYVIRGVNSTGDSTVGVYYDEAVVSASNSDDGGGMQSDIRLYDLDHIEVLRGPQGTLYGASSMSGTIRFITKKPDLESFGGYVTGELSGTNHGSANFDANGAVNIPIITDKMALRVTGWSVNDSGFINQIRLGGVGFAKGINNDEVQGGRIALRIQPIEALTIDASVTAQSETSRGSSRYTPAGVTSWGDPSTPGLVPVQGCDLCNTDVTRSPWSDHLQVYSLTAAYKMKYGTLTATTNQYNRNLDFAFDSTPILVSFAVPEQAATLEPRHVDTNSTEIRYASDFDFPVNFVVGGFREYTTSDLAVHVIATNANGQPIGKFSELTSEDALNFPGVGTTYFGRIDDRTTTEYAGFGEATWNVTSKLSVVGGLRYFTETLDGTQVQTHPFGGFPGSPILTPTPEHASSSKVTFKGNVSYKFNDELLAYVTAAQGFRGGGVNSQSEPFEPIPLSYKPDSLWNYEVGAKGRLFDGALDYQVDAYVLFWYDMQVQATTADGAFVYTSNAGNAVVKGFEFEFDARPIRHLTASFAGSYQDASLTQGASPAQKALNPTLGVTGESIPNVAPFQFNLGLDWTAPLFDGLDYSLGADIDYRGATTAYFASNPFDIPLKAYTLLNLRAGMTNGPWTAQVFIRNATDERAQVSAINSTQDPNGLLTVRPRTVGVSVTRKF